MASPTPGLTHAPGGNPKQAQADNLREQSKEYAEKRLGQSGGGGTSANLKDPMVYLGTIATTSADTKEARLEGAKAPSSVDYRLPASQVAAQYYTWDQATKDKFLLGLNLSGIQNVDQLPDSEIQKLWASYVNQAGSYNASGVKVTPWDILAKDGRQREKAFQKARSVTTTSTNLDMSSALTARAIFQQATHALLGRAPTKAETKLFQSRLNAYEKANPSVSTTTTQYAGGVVGEPGTGEATSQNTTTTGGVTSADRSMMAEDAIKVDPEYGAYQAGAVGMQWLMEAVNGG